MVRFKKLFFRCGTAVLALCIAQRLYLLTHGSVDVRAKSAGTDSSHLRPTARHMAKDTVHSFDDLAITDVGSTTAKPVPKTKAVALINSLNDEKKSFIHAPKSASHSERIMTEEEFVSIIQRMQSGVTLEAPVNLQTLLVEVEGVGAITAKEYKVLKARQFVYDYANPVEKSGVPSTLKPFPDDMERPSPHILIDDDRKVVAEEKVEEQWQQEKRRRLSLGDEDISQLPEVISALQRSTSPIPNIVHFIWFNCRKFRVHHYISMVSAWRIHSPDLILFHTTCEPSGSYWESFKDFANGTLRIVQRTPPIQVWGKPVQKVEHQSDVARLQILMEVGGIYMDDDVVVLRSLDGLRKHEMVLGEENFDAVANSVIMASRDSWFLKRWYQEYQNFNDTRWSDSSCFVPWSLWQLFPDTIHVEKETMLRPNWEEIKFIYHELWDWHNSFTIHLYSRFMTTMEGTSERSIRELAILNTTYGEIARYIIWGDSQPRDITDWILG